MVRDIPELMQRHHLIVLPHREPRHLNLFSQMRGTSRVLMWALACGRGAIASDAQAFAEEVSHGNGAAYRQGDVGALTALLLGVLQEPERIRLWAIRAAALAQERAWPLVGQRFAGHLQRAVNRSPRARAAAAAAGPASVWSPEESA